MNVLILPYATPVFLAIAPLAGASRDEQFTTENRSRKYFREGQFLNLTQCKHDAVCVTTEAYDIDVYVLLHAIG